MDTKIIRGDFIKDKIFNELKSEITEFQELYNMAPGIAFIGFSCVPFAKYNIPLHVQMAQSIGFRVFTEIIPNDASEQDVFDVIDRLNTLNEVHALVLLQPIPEHLNPVRIVNRIDPDKDDRQGSRIPCGS